MGWVSLLLRKQTLRQQMADTELQKMQLSRQLRAFQRQSSYEQTIFNNDKTRELRAAKDPLDKMREERPNVDDPNYKEWAQQYADAKEDYEAKKLDIEDYYDGIMNELEEESEDEETRITTEQDELQAQLEYMSEELSAISEQISNDIKSSAVKFS